LCGTYEADYEIAKEKLTLNKDGAFTQEVTLKTTGKVDVAKGTWKYDSSDGYITFNENMMGVLNGFQEFDPDYLRPNQGQGVLPVEKYLGRISIGSCEGVVYKKVK
jgi:hypothetical protein